MRNRVPNNFDWHRFLTGIKSGDEYCVGPNWSSDNWRRSIKKRAKEGYFKKISRYHGGEKRPFGDWFIRTDQMPVKGKPLNFKQQTHP